MKLKNIALEALSISKLNMRVKDKIPTFLIFCQASARTGFTRHYWYGPKGRGSALLQDAAVIMRF